MTQGCEFTVLAYKKYLSFYKYSKGFLFNTTNCCYNNIDTSFFQINFSKWKNDIFW